MFGASLLKLKPYNKHTANCHPHCSGERNGAQTRTKANLGRTMIFKMVIIINKEQKNFFSEKLTQKNIS